MPFTRTLRPRAKVSITISCDGETQNFDNYRQAYWFFYQKASAIEKVERKERAEEVYNGDVRYVYEAKFVLEEKFGFWVAKTKDNKYNIRRDHRAFKFGSRTMFGLTGKELIEFYHKYVKVCLLEG